MTATTPDSSPDSPDPTPEQPPHVDPSHGTYYRQMAEGWGAQLRKDWRAWVRRLKLWR